MAIQLQEFAQQVLFGTTLEDKLSFPKEEIIDTRPGEAIQTPRTLTRPKHLVLRKNGVKAAHPSQGKLVDERERGRLLHFFGNHELLATELMALVLLKFPDAPASFRRGVLETLKEEQIHTQLYIHRMQQCGVEFGELPLSDYFWRSVSSMEDPLDYVTRLSLTFEQANLDYSKEYGKIFTQVGDAATAKILNKIYHDEIDHVGFGLKWFRRWKANGKTDWEAFRERLSFPLSPARAKGNQFNAQGRLDAGLEPAFVEDLQIFQQSKGRTPKIHWFNPAAEAHAAADSRTIAEESQLQQDLAFLPAYLSRRDDLLLIDTPPSKDFQRELQSYGFHLPELLETTEQHAPPIDRKIAEIRPWSWTPDAVQFFESVYPSLTTPLETKALWSPSIRELYSKQWSAHFARELTGAMNDPRLAPVEVYGHSVDSIEKLNTLRADFAAQGSPDLVCKAPYGTAANANRLIRGDVAIPPAIEQWLSATLKAQGSIVVEPWLERVYDFSVQFEQRGAELRTIGTTRLHNNARGQFKGILTNAFTKAVDPQVVRFLMERSEARPRLYELFEAEIAPRLQTQLQQRRFIGPLGIDAFIYRDPTGSLRMKPIVEINPRVTMGRVAHELSVHNGPGCVGYFQILTKSQLRKQGHTSFNDLAAHLHQTHPVQLTDEPKPRIRSGSFTLNDPQLAKQFLALYHVRRSITELNLD